MNRGSNLVAATTLAARAAALANFGTGAGGDFAVANGGDNGVSAFTNAP